MSESIHLIISAWVPVLLVILFICYSLYLLVTGTLRQCFNEERSTLVLWGILFGLSIIVGVARFWPSFPQRGDVIGVLIPVNFCLQMVMLLRISRRKAKSQDPHSGL